MITLKLLTFACCLLVLVLKTYIIKVKLMVWLKNQSQNPVVWCSVNNFLPSKCFGRVDSKIHSFHIEMLGLLKKVNANKANLNCCFRESEALAFEFQVL